MLESVKRVTDAADADWNITREIAEEKSAGRTARMLQAREGDWHALTKMPYSRMWFSNGDGRV